jgi:hypothetical protein
VALLTNAVLRQQHGALAQLVERYTGSVEVRGSTPLGSTNLSRPCHAELVSASVDQPEPTFMAARWTLKHVQGDGGG